MINKLNNSFFIFIICFILINIQFCKAECVKTEIGNCLIFKKKYNLCVRNYDVTISKQNGTYNYNDINVKLYKNLSLDTKCIIIVPYVSLINQGTCNKEYIQTGCFYNIWLPEISNINTFWLSSYKTLKGFFDDKIKKSTPVGSVRFKKENCNNGYSFLEKGVSYIDGNSTEYYIRNYYFNTYYDYKNRNPDGSPIKNDTYYENHKGNTPCIYFKEII